MTTWNVAVIGIAAATVGFAQAAPEVKTAEQVYKNIVALKGTPADQVVPAMQFMAASLGVECSTCHVDGKYEADDKGAKKTARSMIAMTLEINKASFGGRVQVTCNTCHRGSERPVAIPPVLDADLPGSPAGHGVEPAPAARPAAATPTARGPQVQPDEIIAKYVAAVGGADAIKKINTRVMKGEILVSGSKTPIELLTKAPNKRVSITHSGSSDSYTAYDGSIGWLGNTGRPAREMSAAEAGAASLDAEFALGLRMKEIFPQIRRGRPVTINGVECESLSLSGPGKPATTLSFDKSTGLLVRMVRLADTPVGRNPTQIDYADYRDADGVKIPFRWTLSRPNGRFTIQINEVKSNVAIDDAKFAKPDGPVK